MIVWIGVVWRVLGRVTRRVLRGTILHDAAAMTYYGIFSLFPLMLLVIALAGVALQNSKAAHEQMISFVIQLLPQGQDQLRKLIDGVIEANGTAAGVGFVTLLWAALGWFQVIDANINAIWGVEQSRSFVKSKLIALAMVVGVSGVALASFVASEAFDLIARMTSGHSGNEVVWQVVVSLLSAITIAALFFVLFRYVPQRPVRSADVWPAALAAAVVWELSRAALALYLHATNMISAYGPIGSAMALLFWLYLTSLIILAGAQLAYAIAEERGDAPARGQERTPMRRDVAADGHEEPS